MRTIARSLAEAATVGDPITIPWATLERDLDLHTKELAVVAGAPCAGKSVFALNIALAQPGPVLYLAQDSAPSVYARIAALILGEETRWVVAQLRDDELKAQLIADLRDAKPDLFINQGALTVEGIELRLEALTEVLGIAPPLVIIDNIIDLIVPGYNHTDMGFYASAFNALKQMSHRHNVCILGLHHVTRRGGEKGDPHGLGTRALKMTDLLYSGEREAEHVLGIYHNVKKDRMFIQILKQRDGDADPEGGLAVRTIWHPRHSRMGMA